jgi:hypothetical protein
MFELAERTSLVVSPERSSLARYIHPYTAAVSLENMLLRNESAGPTPESLSSAGAFISMAFFHELEG